MNKIFLIGGSGYLGQYFIKSFSKNNLIYAQINKTIFKKKKNLLSVKKKMSKKELLIYLKKKKINVIVNFSSIANIEFCENNYLKAKNVHENIVKKFVDCASKLNIYFLHISTDHVFDGNLRRSYNEKDIPKGINIYSKTKLKGEKISLKYKNSAVIRTNFFGKSFTNKPSFSDTVINNLSKNRKINLWTDIYFSPIHIINLIYVVKIFIKKKITGLHHVSSVKISKYDLGIKIAKKLKLNHKLITKNIFDKKKFVKRPKNMSLDSKKIRSRIPNLKKILSLDYQLKTLEKFK